jgi:hypothetical protein
MALAYFAAQSGKVEDLMDGVQPVQAPAPVEMPQVDLPPIPGTAPVGSDVPAVPGAAPELPVVRVERVEDAPAPAPEAGDVPQVPAGDGADSAPAVAPGETTGEGSK